MTKVRSPVRFDEPCQIAANLLRLRAPTDIIYRERGSANTDNPGIPLTVCQSSSTRNLSRFVSIDSLFGSDPLLSYLISLSQDRRKEESRRDHASDISRFIVKIFPSRWHELIMEWRNMEGDRRDRTIFSSSFANEKLSIIVVIKSFAFCFFFFSLVYVRFAKRN